MIRKVLAGLGVFVAVAAFAMVIDPGLAAELSLTDRILLLVGAIIGLQTLRVARGRTGTEIEIAETGDPETEQDLVVPGEDFDETVGELKSISHGAAAGRSRRTSHRDHVLRNRDAVRERLEDAAVATIKNKWGVPEARAREALEDGSWTDDPHAAAFFTGELEGVGLRERVYNAVDADARFQRRAKHAAEAIADLSEADADRIRREVTAA